MSASTKSVGFTERLSEGGAGFQPGRRIDRAALGLALTAGLYLFFLNAWHSIPLACASAFACIALGRFLRRAAPLPRRNDRISIRREILRIASMGDDEAAQALGRLIRARYPEERFALTAVLKHPEATLSPGDILSAWKACRGAERLVVACTCPCEPRARLYALELRDPLVAVVDSRELKRMLRRCELSHAAALPRTSPLRLLRIAAARFCCARATPMKAAVALYLLGTYLLTGNPFGLFASMALLAQLGISLGQRRIGRRLFKRP